MPRRVVASIALGMAVLVSAGRPAVSTGTSRLVSHAHGSPSTGAAGASMGPRISADGRYVAFVSSASDLIDGFVDNNETRRDAYLYDRDTGLTTLISHAPGTTTEGSNGSGVDGAPVIAGDAATGYTVFFESDATNLVTDFIDGLGFADVFSFDVGTGAVALVSHRHDSPVTGGNGWTHTPLPTADGSAVVVTSEATDLVDGFTQRNSDLAADVFVIELDPRAISLVSRGADGGLTGGNGDSRARNLVGSTLVLESSSTDLIAGFEDNNGGMSDIYRYDITTGILQLVSRGHGAPTEGSDDENRGFSATSDGRFIPFESRSENLVEGFIDNNGDSFDGFDAYVFDAQTGDTRLVSHGRGSTTEGADAWVFLPVISANGKTIVFSAQASNLAGTDGNSGEFDVFAYSMKSGKVTLISHAAGNKKRGANGYSDGYGVSADGKVIAFASDATNILSVPGNGAYQIYTRTEKRKRLPNGRTKLVPVVRLVSHRHDSVKTGANDSAFLGHWDPTMQTLVWVSQASDVVANFTDGTASTFEGDVYVSR